jgi:hypothetical protein
MLVDFPRPQEPGSPEPAPPPAAGEARVYRLRLRGGGPLLLLLSVASFLMAAEAVTRLARLAEPRASGYAPVNTELLANRHENGRGYRDEERSLAKPPSTHRLLAIGDSFTWGVGVKFEDTYPHRLERDLTLRRRESWEVVNLSLRGMNTVEEAEKLAAEGLAYDPDLVLVGYVLNDSENETSAEKRRAEEWLERRRQVAAPRFWDHSALFRFVRLRIEATLENHRRLADYKDLYADGSPGWTASRQALRKMGGLCRERGIPLLVAIFPLFGNPLDERYPFPDIHAKVGQAAREAGAQVVDLLPVYRGLRWDLLVVDGYDDEHPNEIAHRIAAGVLVRALDDIIPFARTARERQVKAPEPRRPPGPEPRRVPAAPRRPRRAG